MAKVKERDDLRDHKLKGSRTYRENEEYWETGPNDPTSATSGQGCGWR